MKFTSKPNQDGWVQCLCPFHSDSNPSSSYNLYSGFFICWGCSLRLKYKDLKARLGYEPKKYTPKTVITNKGNGIDWGAYYHSANTSYHDYLGHRNVTPVEQKRYHIRWTEDGILIPIVNNFSSDFPKIDGLVVRRFSSDLGRYRYYFNKDKPAFYPADVTFHTPASTIFVEGVFGVLNLKKGYKNVYATLGANVSTKQKRYIAAMSVTSFIAFDDDLPGITNAIALAQCNTQARVILPGVEADEVDINSFAEMTKHAEPFAGAFKYWQDNLMYY